MDAAQIERDFERMLRIKGQKITPELVKLPLESKQQLLVQNEKLSTPRPPTPPTKSASSNETIVPIRRSVFGQVGSLFRSPLTRSASVPLPLPLSPTPVPNPGTAESSFFRDVAVPLPLPLLSVTAPAQSTTQPIPQPVPQPNQIQTEDADLIRNFENVLASLNVSGSQKQDVLAMFEKANLESKKAILQKYSILLNHTQLASTTSIPPAPEPVNQIQQSDVRHVQSVENVQTLEPIPPPPSYDISQNTPPISNEPSQSSASALEIVMSPTIYPYEPQPNLPSNSDEVLNETEPHSFEVLADIVTERVPLSPPKPESALMINLSTTPPASPNLLSKSLDDNSLMPKSVEVIITQLMDQSLTSKALFRILSNLPSLLSDTSSVFQKQFTHVTVYILDLRASITGLDALQHVLRRLHDGTSFSDISRRGLPPTKSKQGSRNGTITFSSVRADEIRLRVLDCLSCFHRTDLVSTRNLVAEVVYLLMSMDGIILSENLVMRARAYDLAAVFCLEGVEALRLVQQGLEYIDGVGTLVPTLLDPFRLVVGGAGGGGRSFGAGGGGSATVNRDRKGKVPVDPAFETPEAGAGLDASVVWRFRISLLKFIVSYIDSDENVAGRSKLRKSLEAAGLRDVIEEVMLLASAAASDVSGNEIGEFVECVELYEMGRTDDADEIRQDAEIPRVAMQGAMSPYQITNDILLSLAASSSETKEVGTSILEHLQSFFAALKTTPQTINLLALTDRLTYIIANAAFESYDDWRVVAHSLVDAVESASGFQGGSRELHNGMIHSLRQEIEDLKVNLLISQSSEEQRRQEIADLQEYISGQQIQAVSQSNLEDEVRRLKELVGTLAHERDEALAAVKTEKQLLRKKTILSESAHQNVASGSSEKDLPVLDVPLSGGLQSLDWAKVPEKAVNNSVWKQVVNDSYVKPNSLANKILEPNELEALSSLFEKGHEISEAPLQKVVILDKARSHQIQALFGNLYSSEGSRLTRQQVRDGIVSMSPEVLTPENIDILLQIIPTESEIELVKSFNGDPASLPEGEKFIKSVASIPRLKMRLESVSFQNRFLENVVEIETNLKCISQAIDDVMTSEKFKKVLEAVLVIGNFVNKNTFRGGAYGFEMSSLLKLRDIKASENSNLKNWAPTMLHYLARRLQETDEKVLDLQSELPTVGPASRISIEGLLQAVQDLKDAFNEMENETIIIEQMEGETAADNVFLYVTKGFIHKNESILNQVCDLADSVEWSVHKLLVYLGESYKSDGDNISNAQELFRVIWTFQESLNRANEENQEVDDIVKRKQNQNSRQVVGSSLQKTVLDQKGKLRAVEGMAPFSDRGLTVRNGKLVVGEGDEDEEIPLREELSMSGFKQTLESRKITRRLTKHSRALAARR